MEYKHFSHVHGLAHHQMPQGAEIQCSGCKFPGSGHVYACWQCNYFLHEQCFQAGRSLKHPSHTTHPLTLVPYPTYPSNSFYCNTCNLVGSGFSYGCSECEFDLHVHCAFAPNHPTPPPPPPQPENPSPVPHSNYPNLGYGGAQSFNPQPASPAPAHQTPGGYPYQNIQNTGHHPGFPPNYPPIPSSAPVSYHESSIQHNSGPNLPPANNPSLPPHTYLGSIQQNPLLNSPPPMPNSYQEPTQHHGIPNPVTTASVPTGYPESTQPPSNPPMPSYNNAPTSSSQAQPPDQVGPQLPQASAPIRISLLSNPLKAKEIKHFSHPHALTLNEIKDTDPKVCSGCEDDLTGSAYSCVDPQCNFNLHKSCFELPLEIRHKSHLDHPLKLLAKPPSHYTDNQFACNACLQSGAAFVYNCEKCAFDLHVECVSLPESIIRPDHKHPLKLFYSNPVPKPEEQQEVTFVCDVCQKPVHDIAWIYSCHECEFGTHLECAAYEVQPAQKTEEELIREAEIKMAMLNLLINGALS